MHFILDMILMALLPLSFHLFWETPWKYHRALMWTECLSPVRYYFMNSPLKSNAPWSSYYSERKSISVASFRKALTSDFEAFINRRITLTRADHPSKNIPPHSPSKTGRWRQLLSVRMGKRSFKSLMILPTCPGCPQPLIPASGVSAGLTAAALELRQRTELQLSNLLTVPCAVTALSRWNTQRLQFTAQHVKGSIFQQLLKPVGSRIRSPKSKIFSWEKP